jgi:rhodanese-related sulfurtransferase
MAYISAADVRDLLRHDRPVQLIDVRPPAEFEVSDVGAAGAIRVLPDQVDGHLNRGELRRDATIVIYGEEDDARRVMERLHQLGLKQSFVVVGGLEALRAEEVPLVARPRIPAEVQQVWGHS